MIFSRSLSVDFNINKHGNHNIYCGLKHAFFRLRIRSGNGPRAQKKHTNTNTQSILIKTH